MNNKTYHLLFVDDDKEFLDSMHMSVADKIASEQNGIELETHFANEPHEALEFASELIEEGEKIAGIVSDQQMPGLTGIELLEQAQTIVPNAFKVLLTGYASLDAAKYAINNRILDQYVSKPIEDYDNFGSLIKNGVHSFHLREEKEWAEREIKRYIEELKKSNDEIRSMHKAAEKIAYVAQGFRKLDLDEVCDLIVTRIPMVFNAGFASLFLLNEKTNCLEQVRSNYLGANYKKTFDVKANSPMIASLRDNKIIVLSDIDRAGYEFMQKPFLGPSCIIIPFIVNNDEVNNMISGMSSGIKGVLNLSNIEGIPNEEVAKYAATLIKDILGINILNARLYKKTHELAIKDGLTGLYNKQVFLEFLAKECALSERNGRPITLSVLDLDNFKHINDTYGHQVGDIVLQKLGATLQHAARRCDVTARLGGEEFAWMMAGSDLPISLKALERFVSDLEKMILPNNIVVTSSIGVTRFRTGQGDSVTELVERADKAMYLAKSRGKNRIEVSDEHDD